MTSSSSIDWHKRVKSAVRGVIVSIQNNCDNPLKRDPLQPCLHGDWAFIPPETIEPNQKVSFGVFAKGLMTGCEALVSYNDPKNPQFGAIIFQFEAPFVGKNNATSSSAPACFKVSMSDSGSGSLFNVDYTVEYGTKAAVKQQQADQKQQPTLESLERIESDEWKAEMKKSARSVLVSINNRTGVNLFRNTMSLSAGRWRRPPPERIEIDEIAEFGSESDKGEVGTEGRVSFTYHETVVEFVWKNPLVGAASFASSVPPNSPVVVSKFTGSGNAASVVFDIRPVPKATVATFGRPFGDIVTAHGGVPRLVAQIVAVLAERGRQQSNHGAFTGVVSFSELTTVKLTGHVRAAVASNSHIKLEKYSARTLSHVLKNFLNEIPDAPMAKFILDAHSTNFETLLKETMPVSTKHARDADVFARQLFISIINMLGAICYVSSAMAAASSNSRANSTSSVSTATSSSGGDGSAGNQTPSPIDVDGAGLLTPHELAVLFVPMLVHGKAAIASPSSPSDPNNNNNKNESNDNVMHDAHSDLRRFRGAVERLCAMIESARDLQLQQHSDIKSTTK